MTYMQGAARANDDTEQAEEAERAMRLCEAKIAEVSVDLQSAA